MAGMNYIDQYVCTVARYRHLLVGSWDCNGPSNPTALTGDLKKLGSVVRTSAGLFTFTFAQKPGKIVEATAELRGNVTAGDFACVDTLDAAAGTITVRTKDAGGNNDIPSGEAIRVVVWVWVGKMKNLQND